MSANYKGPPEPASPEEAGYVSWEAYLVDLEADATSGFVPWEDLFREEERVRLIIQGQVTK